MPYNNSAGSQGDENSIKNLNQRFSFFKMQIAQSFIHRFARIYPHGENKNMIPGTLFKNIHRHFHLFLNIASFGKGFGREQRYKIITVTDGLGDCIAPILPDQQFVFIQPYLYALGGKVIINLFGDF